MFFTNIFFGGGTLDSTLPFFAPEYAPRTAELLAVLALDLYGPYAYGRYGTMPHTLSPCSITITLQYSTRYTHEGAWGCTDSCSPCSPSSTAAQWWRHRCRGPLIRRRARRSSSPGGRADSPVEASRVVVGGEWPYSGGNSYSKENVLLQDSG